MGSLASVGMAGLSSAADMAATVMTNHTNQQIASETNYVQHQIANENNKTQIAMNDKNNQFNADEAQKARDFQEEQWNRENEYNSPAAQMERYRAAGINPNVAMEKAGLTSGASVGSTSAAHASGSGVNLSMPNFVTPTLQTPQIGQSLANIYTALTQGELNKARTGRESAETQKTLQSINAYVESLASEAAFKKIQASIQEAYGEKLAQSEIDKNESQMLLNSQHITNLIKEGKLTEASTELEKQKKVTERWRSKEQRVRAENVLAEIQASINESKSRAASNYASAAKTNEETSQLKEMHPDIVRLQRYNADQKYSDAVVAYASIFDRIADWKNRTYDSVAHRMETMEKIKVLEGELQQYKDAHERHDKQMTTYWFDKCISTAATINSEVNKWAPWAFSRETQVEDNDGNISVSRTSYSR